MHLHVILNANDYQQISFKENNIYKKSGIKLVKVPEVVLTKSESKFFAGVKTLVARDDAHAPPRQIN